MRFIFGDYVLDTARRELRSGSNAIDVEPQVFDLLTHLICNRDRVLTKDDLFTAVWRGRIVSEATLNSRINSVRRAIGDSGKTQRLIKTVSRIGFRFIGDVRECSGAVDNNATGDGKFVTAATSTAEVPPQNIGFITTNDNVRIAFATVGDGPPVVKVSSWLNHLEHDWRSPVSSSLLSYLAARFRLVRYDGRGFGLSDWHVPELSFDACVRDLEAVVDAVGVKHFALLGISAGVAISVAYAVRHPDRVSRLVLVGGFPHGWFKRGNSVESVRAEALITMIQHGWGRDEDSAFHRLFTAAFVPGGTREQIQWFKDLQRVSTSGENAARMARMFGDVDILNLLPLITVPTLVMHSHHDARVPFQQGLEIARGIPNSRFVSLESCNHLLLSQEPAWQSFVEQLDDFLHEERAKHQQPA